MYPKTSPSKPRSGNLTGEKTWCDFQRKTHRNTAERSHIVPLKSCVAEWFNFLYSPPPC